MTNPEHAKILADIASQVAAQYSKAPGAFTTNPEDGHVPVPVKLCAGKHNNHSWFNGHRVCDTCNGYIDQPTMIDPGWDWTLAERYRP
jgi:hypothetical protein